MQFWDCEDCGCQAIAGTIEQCPVCGHPRNVPGETLQSDASDVPSTEPAAPRAPAIQDVALPDDGWGDGDA